MGCSDEICISHAWACICYGSRPKCPNSTEYCACKAAACEHLGHIMIHERLNPEKASHKPWNPSLLLCPLVHTLQNDVLCMLFCKWIGDSACRQPQEALPHVPIIGGDVLCVVLQTGLIHMDSLRQAASRGFSSVFNMPCCVCCLCRWSGSSACFRQKNPH